MSVANLAERLQAAVDALVKGVEDLNDQSVPDAEITRAKVSIGKIRAMIVEVDKSVERLRALSEKVEDTATALEEAAGDLETVAADLEGLE